MRYFHLLLFLLSVQLLPAQARFARFYKLPDGTSNSINSIGLQDTSLLIRMNVSDAADPLRLKTRLVNLPFNTNQFDDNFVLPEIEAGNSVFKDGDFYFFPAVEGSGNQYLTLHKLDKSFVWLDSINLKLPGNDLYYFSGQATLFKDKYVVCGSSQNKNGYPFGQTVVFIVNKDFTLFKTLIIPQVRQLIVPRDLAISPLDGRLYLSLVYDNFFPNDSTFVPAPVCQKIVSLNDAFEFENFWNSGEFINGNGISERAPIAFSPEGNLYSYYDVNGLDYITAIDPNGQTIWKTPLDSFAIFGPTVLWFKSRPFSIQDIAVGANGDVIAAGLVEDTKDNIGRSSFIVRMSPQGVKKWIKIYRSNNFFSFQKFGYGSAFQNVVELPNGDIVAGGSVLLFDEFMPNSIPEIAPWLVHADSNGCISPACNPIQDAVQKSTWLPIVSPANEWTVAHYEPFLSSRRKYRFSSDSVLLGGQYYRELKYEDSFLGAQSSGRFYREAQGVVTRYNGPVVYNLNLGASDTLPAIDAPNYFTRAVASVGTVIYSDGIPRKTMQVYCAADSTAPLHTVVEGMGNLEEFFFSEIQCINPLDGPTDLLECFRVNGETLYLKPGASCELSATEGPEQLPRAAVFPNPAAELLNITLPQRHTAAAYRVLIYHASGQLALDQTLMPVADALQVPVSALSPGAYYGQLRRANGESRVFAFVRGR